MTEQENKTQNKEQKQDISIKIDETNFSKNPEFAKILKTGQEFKGDDLQAFLQTMVVMDEAIASKNEKNLEFSGDSIKLQLSDVDGTKIDINAKLGEGYFSKDLDHLVNLGSKDISQNAPSKEAKEVFAKAVEREPSQEQEKNKNKDLDKANTAEIEEVGTKKEPLRFKNPASSTSLDNVLNGGIQAVATMAESVGDEALSGFAKNVCDMYRGVGGIVPSSVGKSSPSLEEQMNQINNNNVKKVSQAVKDGKVKISSKQREEERTNNKTRDKGR